MMDRHCNLTTVGIGCVCLLFICIYYGHILKNVNATLMNRPMPKKERSAIQSDQYIAPNKTGPQGLDGRCDDCFKWKLNKTIISPPKAFCQNAAKMIDLLIIYISAPQNGKRRDLLRQMYTEDADIKDQLRVVFAFGKLNESDQRLIDQENETYGDVLEFNCLDSYYTMYILHTNSLHWVHSQCTNVRFTVKMVDDAFLNTVGVLKLLDKYGPTQLKDVIFGSCGYSQVPRRYPHKWMVSVKDYPFPKYPGLCGGGGIFMSFETGKALLTETSNIRFVTRLDDLDIGINALLAKRCICHIPGFYLGYWASNIVLEKLSPMGPVDCRRFPLNPFLALHMFTTQEDSWMRYVWQHRTCYADSIPENVVCPSWGECPDNTYPLPRG